MSNIFSPEKYIEKVNLFDKVCKRVEVFETQSRQLPTDKVKLNEYKTDIANTYNDLLSYICDFYSNAKSENQSTFKERIEKSIRRIKRSFNILNLTYVWSDDIFKQITLSEIRGRTELHSPIDPSQSESTNESGDDISEDELINLANVEDNNTEENLTVQSRQNIHSKMTQTRADFMKLAASILNYKFDGNPLKLESFLTDIELVESLAEDNNKELCFKFIKSKLEAKALECLPANTQSIKQITDALQTEIHQESSAVIDGKIMAIRLEKGNFSKFSKAAEELAEQFRRSLISEGIPKAKASEMTIAKTVDLCRKTARSEVVKSVLSASKFETPERVISEFIIQNDLARKEKREFEQYKGSKGSNTNKNFSKKFNKNQNGQRFNRNNSDNRNNYGSRNGNRGGGNGNHGNNRGGNSFRGNRNHNNGQNRDHTIRIVQGNSQSPSNGGNPTEQIYQVPFSQ